MHCNEPFNVAMSENEMQVRVASGWLVHGDKFGTATAMYVHYKMIAVVWLNAHPVGEVQ